MNDGLSHIRSTITSIEEALSTDIIGQKDLKKKLLIALFAGGHILLEGAPGLGKTKTVKSLAKVLGFDFDRISFTPDLLPTDLTGLEIYRPQSGKFEVRKGPIFTQFLLADEINRTPPKVQSALLEAMEEGAVTISTETLLLPSPFFVIATENPLEHEGTYPLPEAQLDRFMMKILIGYPSPEDEKIILSNIKPTNLRALKPTLTPSELIEMRDYLVKNIHIDPKVYDYISDILEATRGSGVVSRESTADKKNRDFTLLFRSMRNAPQNEQDEPYHRYGRAYAPSYISYGASTRAGLALRDGARVVALMSGRDYVTPDDVKYLAHDVLRHRIGRSYEAIAKKISTDDIIAEILESVVVR